MSVLLYKEKYTFENKFINNKQDVCNGCLFLLHPWDGFFNPILTLMMDSHSLAYNIQINK